MDIIGRGVVLRPLTRELCHEIYKRYVADQMMTDEAYEYSVEKVNAYFDERIKEGCLLLLLMKWLLVKFK